MAEAADEEFHGEEKEDDHREAGEEESRHDLAPVLDIFSIQVDEAHADRVEFGVAEDDQRHEEIVPSGEELEDAESGEDGAAHRNDDVRELLEVRSTVDFRRFEEVGRDIFDEVAEHIDAEDLAAGDAQDDEGVERV